jgi:hypothetical protein
MYIYAIHIKFLLIALFYTIISQYKQVNIMLRQRNHNILLQYLRKRRFYYHQC